MFNFVIVFDPVEVKFNYYSMSKTRYPRILFRIITSVMLFLLCTDSFSQTKKFDLSFVVSTGPKKYLKQLDSVSIWHEKTGEEWIYDTLKTKDSVFRIEGLELGKYRIVVYKKSYVIPFVDFSVCTICRNKVSMVASTSTANKVFDRLSIGPHYETGFKQLSADFLSALTKDEVKVLKKSDNKMKVRCFITAEDKLSDVIFEEPNLSEETKKLILKGFEKTKAWRAAVANGKPVDDYLILSVAKIVD